MRRISILKNIMNKLLKYLLQGLLYFAPLAITGYIIYESFMFIDGILKDLLSDIFGITIPGLGILIIAITLILVGILGETIIANPLQRMFTSLTSKVPLLRFIYSALSDLFSAFVGKEKKFNQPVIVMINPGSNLEKLGFMTQEDLSPLNEKDKVAIYFPHSYAFSGELFIVPRNQVREVNLNPGDVMKFVVSAGVTGWDNSEISAE